MHLIQLLLVCGIVTGVVLLFVTLSFIKFVPHNPSSSRRARSQVDFDRREI